MPRVTSRVLLVIALFSTACGSGGGASPTASSPSPSAPPVIASPCTAALAAIADEPKVVHSAASVKEHGGLGNDKRDPREHLWSHRVAPLEGRVTAKDVRAAAAGDVGDIAVLQDNGSLIVSPNPFTLAGQGLRFQPNASGGYDVSRTAGPSGQTSAPGSPSRTTIPSRPSSRSRSLSTAARRPPPS